MDNLGVFETNYRGWKGTNVGIFFVSSFFESGWKILATQKDEHNPLTKFSYFTHSVEHENQISREYSTKRGRRSHRLRSQYIHAYNQPIRMQLPIACAINRISEILR